MFLLICALALNSCSKDQEREYKLDPAGLKYIQLRPNQYFIYRDSASGKLDSVVVAESSLQSEQFSYTFFSTTPTTANRDVFRLTLLGKTSLGDSTWLNCTAKAFPTSTVVLNDTRSECVFLYPTEGSFSQSYQLPTLTVETTSYSNVVVRDKVIAQNFQCTYYWAASVGLIKVVKRQAGQSWIYTLLRHN
jgi:hypothetical protein